MIRSFLEQQRSFTAISVSFYGGNPIKEIRSKKVYISLGVTSTIFQFRLEYSIVVIKLETIQYHSIKEFTCKNNIVFLKTIFIL